MWRIVKLFHKGGYVLHFFTQGTEKLFQNINTVPPNGYLFKIG